MHLKYQICDHNHNYSSKITIYSGCGNGILLWGLEVKIFSMGEKKTFRVKWGLNEDLFQSFWGLLVVIFIKVLSKTAYLQQMTFRDNWANSTKQNVKRERYSDMPLFTMIIMHALTAMFSWVSLGNHPILQLSTSCLSRTFSNVISMAESQSIMIHNNGENEDFCVKWGPNEDHFSNLVLMHDIHLDTSLQWLEQGLPGDNAGSLQDWTSRWIQRDPCHQWVCQGHQRPCQDTQCWKGRRRWHQSSWQHRPGQRKYLGRFRRSCLCICTFSRLIKFWISRTDLLDELVVTENNNADVVRLQVEGHALQARAAGWDGEPEYWQA